MAGITEKLYPPIINGTLPAFYGEKDETNGTTVAEIVVPFSMNRAVSSSEISGFSLKIKTVQSNTFIDEIKTGYESLSEALERKQVTFFWKNVPSSVVIGQFLKVQLAYYTERNGEKIIGYYSTVGIIKYTAKPNVYIEGLSNDSSRISTFHSSYTGVYEPTEDKSERPYSYCFSLYDEYEQLVETSGWLLHNTSINNVASESLSLEKTTDTYSFNTQVASDQSYYIQYKVRTINNLEIGSPIYLCAEPRIGRSNLEAQLKAENIFDEGYIKVSFSLDELEDNFEQNNFTFLNEIQLQKKYHAKQVQFFEEDDQSYYIITKQDDTNLRLNKTELNKPISIEIYRSEKTDAFSSWELMQCVYISTYEYALNWSFKDFTIEQGVAYQYCFRQYNEHGVQSDRSFSNEVIADFEDMFLWDGEKQLKIRFNPKISSFKINRLEQKMDTIGNRFPFIFRNGQVEYKEFPISGLISYFMDNNELFFNHQDDLNIIPGSKMSRKEGTPITQDDIINADGSTSKSWEISETLDSIGYNMRAERRFKLKIMEWLGDGKIKLFKSPAEGNYFVRLLNISLSPEDKLSRMLHTFSCTAYEIKEFNHNNLLELGFLNPHEADAAYLAIKSIKIADLLNNDMNLSTMIKINNNPIIETIIIEPDNNSLGEQQFVRIGLGKDSLTTIFQGNKFTINVENTKLPDLYFCPNDYIEFLNLSENENKIQALKDLIGNLTITYKYLETKILVGDFNNIKEVYLQNKVETAFGPIDKTFDSPKQNIVDGKTISTEETMKFLSINIFPKTYITIYGKYVNDRWQYYEQNTISSTPIPTRNLDSLSFYRVIDIDDNNHIMHIYRDPSSQQMTGGTSTSYQKKVILTCIDSNGENTTETYEIGDLPIQINLDKEHLLYSKISIKNGAYVNYAYQNKIIEYND